MHLQVQYLSMLGGVGPKDVIKKIMKQVLTDDLAKEFNWQGRGDKRPFSQLAILTDVIRGTVNSLLHEHFPHSKRVCILLSLCFVCFQIKSVDELCDVCKFDPKSVQEQL